MTRRWLTLAQAHSAQAAPVRKGATVPSGPLMQYARAQLEAAGLKDESAIRAQAERDGAAVGRVMAACDGALGERAAVALVDQRPRCVAEARALVPGLEAVTDAALARALVRCCAL